MNSIVPLEHFVIQSVKILSRISGLRLWYPLIIFGHKINLIGFYVFNVTRLMNQLDFLIEKCLEVLYFLSAFVVAAESIEKRLLTSFISKYMFAVIRN